MARKPVKYCIVDAFTESAFKGNPAAVCLLDEEDRDDEWLKNVACEFNLPITCFLTPLISQDGTSLPKYRLRWFAPFAELKICGHATIAAAHFLFTYGLVKSDIIKFSTLSGILTAKRVPEIKVSDNNQNGSNNAPKSFHVELDFPAFPIMDYDLVDDDEVVSTISKSLNGATISEIHKAAKVEDLLVVLPSGDAVIQVEPRFDEMLKCPNARGLFITGPAPTGSGFDFISRTFFPKIGINEDLVCGSAHCSLAPYWSKKLGKSDLAAYQASSRSGVLKLHFDEENQRVLLRGKAVAVMEGSILV